MLRITRLASIAHTLNISTRRRLSPRPPAGQFDFFILEQAKGMPLLRYIVVVCECTSSLFLKYLSPVLLWETAEQFKT